MDLEEILTWTDDQVFSHTGKHLDSLQKSILEGLWQHQDYEEIADNNHRSYNHIKKEASKLWKILSKVFNENIKQSNVKAILETKAISNIYIFSDIHNSINKNNINICAEKKQSLEEKQPPSQSSNQTPIIDLTNAPEIPYNYHNRTSELSKLKQWILQQHSKLITIYGLTGIGKTSLILKLI
jgi:flagellar biosynthesis GTPase FlhF